jgi:hypothetical protein
MPRFVFPVSALAILIFAACGNGSSTTTAGATGTGGGSGGGGTGPITDCKMLSTNQCFSNDDCSSASDRCEDKGTTDAPVSCCLPGARGTGMAGTPCKTTNDCVTTCVFDASDNLLCSKPCTADTDCPASLPTCITLNTGIGTGSFCGPS